MSAFPVKTGSSIRHRGGKGEPLLLLHGFSACAETWTPLFPALERTHDVVAVTFNGHMGGEPLPPGFPHTIAASADLAEAELDAAGFGKVHLVGNSLGGWIAIELARRGRALSMVAISPGGGWEPGSPEQLRVKALFLRIRATLHVGGPLAPVLARFAPSRKVALGEIVAHPERLTPEEARLIIRSSWLCDAFDGVLHAMSREPAPAPIDTTPCPMRILWGTRDRVLPMASYSARWRRVLPGAEWLELEGLGHLPWYDDAGAVARAILDVTARPQGAQARAS